MSIFALLVANTSIVLLLFLVGQVFAAFFIPRLELAKGIGGTPQKISAMYSLWGLASIWKSKEITWKSLWIPVLGLQTLMSSVFLGPIFTMEWIENEKLLIPLIFLFIQILITSRIHIYQGEKHPNIRTRTYSALVGAMGLATVLYGITPHQHIEGLMIIGYIIKWLTLLFLYMSLVSFLTFEKNAEVPEVVSRLSQIVWAVGLVMIFWPPQGTDLLSGSVEQYLKAQGVLIIHDIGRIMFAKVKTRFFENFVMSLVIPLIFLASIVIAMGF